MKINYRESPDFPKDIKSLLKRFRTLRDDLEIAKKNAIELFHLQGIDNQSVFQVPQVGTAQIQIYKLKKFACRALKGRGNKSGIRVIYAFYPADHLVEFIEMYFKTDQEEMTFERVKKYIKKINR